MEFARALEVYGIYQMEFARALEVYGINPLFYVFSSLSLFFKMRMGFNS